MAITWPDRRALFILLSLPGLALSQTLEDKLSQTRKMQAQSAMGLSDQAMDSLLEAKKAQAPKRGSKAMAGNQDAPPSLLDSLISGPAPDTLDTAATDTLASAQRDSLRVPRKGMRPRVPKRYEQRIFQSVDRSAFGNANGAAGRDYVLGPGDQITISLWGDKEKEYDIVLNPEGKAFVEGIGLIPLAGLNLNEAQARLKERLGRIYSGISRGSAHVDVSVGKVGPIKVFVLGEVKVPGGYVLSGNPSVLSAVYFAQGPSDIGTVRNMQLTRGGKKHPLDLYQYLIYGQSLNPDVLRDGDILFSARAEILVEIAGDIGRPATYELKKGEGVKELLEFAGRLNATAARHRLVLRRVFEGGKIDYVDLAPPQDYLSGKAVMPLQDGDKVSVEKSTEPTSEFITISGPVKYPGTYSSRELGSVQDLIARAGGLREEAYLGRAHIVRFLPDGSSQLFAYDLDSARIGSIKLQPKDNVILYSTKEMFLPDSVEVVGAVFNPGKYEFRKGMGVKDLIMQAGGLLPQHETGRALVFRGDVRERKVDAIPVSLGNGLDASSQKFELQPRDLVQLPTDPLWYTKEVVVLEGLFKHPGRYALLQPGERIASVIARAGGFKDGAYVEGGRFFRSKDSVGRVGVDIRRALAKPGRKADIALVNGDSIFIPSRMNTVKIIGEVGFETSVLFQEGASVQYYIERAGGFTRRSEKDRVVVQYANGETSRDGYFNRKPDAGSVIYVPQGPEPQPINWVSGVNTILGTLGVAAAVILSIQAISNN
jgi:polysaccharide biosynthesis/export protein